MHPPTRPASARVAMLLLLALTAGCSGLLSRPSPTGVVHPLGDELILRVEHAGGFVPVDFLLTSLPTFTLTGDGRVIVPGAQIAIFPGPALPAVQVRRLNDRGIQAVLEAVAASGQFGADREWRGAQDFVADAGDTIFTLRADGRSVQVRIHALGIVDSSMPGISAEERAAHLALAALRDQLTGLDAWLSDAAWADPGWQPYQADGLRLIVGSADGEAPNEEGIIGEERPWPGPGDPAAFGEPALGGEGLRCGIVTGDTAAEWYAELATANQLTRWTFGDHRYRVAVRPLLPDEAEACPKAA